MSGRQAPDSGTEATDSLPEATGTPPDAAHPVAVPWVMADARDPRARFTDRVDDYIRYRPGYPGEVIALLARECGLTAASVVADVGSGTGILSKLLLETGARVVAVEPNAAMRAAAGRDLGGSPRFQSVDGSAEATGLDPSSVDLVTAAQAFHWFDPVRTRAELVRILRSPGSVALVWNDRASTPFNDDYEAMLDRFAPDYASVRERDRSPEPKMRAFFAPAEVHRATFPNRQVFDEAGLRGRLMSSSYAPRPGHPMHEPILARLAEVFAIHARDGKLELLYETVVYWGRLV
jgi:SAM-dependent methyltransferase